MSEFHSSKPWQKLSAEFKTLRCVDCKSKEDIEAGHVLPAASWKMMRLWKSNLVPQCRSCNAKLGSKIHWQPRAIILILEYGMIKGIYWLTIILYFSLTTAVIYKDVSTGGMETSFTGQVLIESWEQLQQIKEYL